MKQHITELKAKNAKFKKKNTEIFNLRIKLLVFDAEIAKSKHKNAKILRANRKYNERHDAEARIEKLESENIEFRNRLTKVKQN